MFLLLGDNGHRSMEERYNILHVYVASQKCTKAYILQLVITFSVFDFAKARGKA